MPCAIVRRPCVPLGARGAAMQLHKEANGVKAPAKEDDSSDTWIFGFGSLVWKAGFEYSDRVEGYIKGFKLKFYQGSTDHRGTEDAPGRTATIVEDSDATVWGAAYLLRGTKEQQSETLKALEWREKQYDKRLRLPVFSQPCDSEPRLPSALVYVATANSEKNKNWLGPAPLEQIAQQIATAHGPSGPNREYLFHLADAVRRAGAHDEELEWLDARVKKLVRNAAT